MSEPPRIPDELIKIKAHQIGEKRELEGKDGTPQTDWEEAKRYLKNHRWEVRQWKFFRRITLWWEATLIEKCLESIEFLLQKLAFLTILGRLGELALIVAVVSFVVGENGRRNNEVFAAWQTITSAEGQSGSGGRIEALEFLNYRPWRLPWILFTETWTGQTEKDWFWDEQNEKCVQKHLFGRRWDREPLVGLSAKNAYLVDIHLCGSNLQNALLWHANLQNSKLEGVILENARLSRANLQNARLSHANLQNGVLIYANLQNAVLTYANLQQAILIEIENLTPQQIKSACFWDKAIYKGKWNRVKRKYVAIEPDNTNYIEELKKDTASNPEEPPDCSWW